MCERESHSLLCWTLTCALTASYGQVQGRNAFRINIETAGGHAAMPPIDASHAGRIAGEVLRAIDITQPPLALRAPVTHLFQAIAPHGPFLLRGLLSLADTWYVLSAYQL